MYASKVTDLWDHTGNIRRDAERDASEALWLHVVHGHSERRGGYVKYVVREHRLVPDSLSEIQQLSVTD